MLLRTHGQMVGFQRYDHGNYRCDIKLIDLEKAANKEKYVPRLD